MIDFGDIINYCKIIHNNFYSYAKTTPVSQSQNMLITCPAHGDFIQRLSHHRAGHGCSKCGKIKSDIARKYLFDELVARANIIFNNKYDYSDFSHENIKTKSYIKCPIHSYFIMNFDAHIHKKRGCPKCSKNATYFLSLEERVDLANKIHENKYIYTKCVDGLMNNKQIIICQIHGDFLQKFTKHIAGRQGCPKCAPNCKLSRDEIIKRAVNIHGNEYDYSKLLGKAINKKEIVICRIHGEWLIDMSDHIWWQIGCPGCGGRSSAKERNWLSSLNIVGLERQKFIKSNNKKYCVDGFDANTNTIYEFYGDFWHGNPNVFPATKLNTVNNKTCGQLYLETIERTKIFIANGYNVVEMWECEWDEKNRIKK